MVNVAVGRQSWAAARVPSRALGLAEGKASPRERCPQLDVGDRGSEKLGKAWWDRKGAGARSEVP